MSTVGWMQSPLLSLLARQGWADEEPPHLTQPHTSASTPPQLDKTHTVPSDTHFSCKLIDLTVTCCCSVCVCAAAGVMEVGGEQPDAFGDTLQPSGELPIKYEATPTVTRYVTGFICLDDDGN